MAAKAIVGKRQVGAVSRLSPACQTGKGCSVFQGCIHTQSFSIKPEPLPAPMNFGSMGALRESTGSRSPPGIKARTNILDYIKLQSSCPAKETINRVKTASKVGEEPCQLFAQQGANTQNT